MCLQGKSLEYTLTFYSKGLDKNQIWLNWFYYNPNFLFKDRKDSNVYICRTCYVQITYYYVQNVEEEMESEDDVYMTFSGRKVSKGHKVHCISYNGNSWLYVLYKGTAEYMYCTWRTAEQVYYTGRTAEYTYCTRETPEYEHCTRDQLNMCTVQGNSWIYVLYMENSWTCVLYRENSWLYVLYKGNSLFKYCTRETAYLSTVQWEQLILCTVQGEKLILCIMQGEQLITENLKRSNSWGQSCDEINQLNEVNYTDLVLGLKLEFGRWLCPPYELKNWALAFTLKGVTGYVR